MTNTIFTRATLAFCFYTGAAFAAEAAGALLPVGDLSTSGNQIIDATTGASVRLACAGYDQPSGNIGSDIAKMKKDGFNCLRFPYYNATLSADLKTADAIVKAAKAHGMKVIIDHHGDETPSKANKYLPFPANGLPIDKGDSTDGTDGSGDKGTVDLQRFVHDWAVIARHFANEPIVIGFDLTNEPHLNPYDPATTKKATAKEWGSTWGDGGANDIVPIYQQAGNAIHERNPNVLIICEGVLNKTHTLFSGRSTIIPGFPDLSGVTKHPVVLKHPNKLVYSVHDYPTTIGGTTPDSGRKKITAMNVSWGYIFVQKIAPIWIGEMGASLDRNGSDVLGKTDSETTANLADEKKWAAELTDYLNGKDASLGGPAISGCQVGISTDWWRWGHWNGLSPDGTLGDDGNPRPEQKAVTDKLLFVPVAKCSP